MSAGKIPDAEPLRVKIRFRHPQAMVDVVHRQSRGRIHPVRLPFPDKRVPAGLSDRAGRLADQALFVWPAPNLDAATMAAYQPKKAAGAGAYGIEDHPHLLTPGLDEVFEAFRKEVLALDPCVSEEFMRWYVAYKAETNVVIVVPKAKFLRLGFNLSYAEFNDPKGLCKDVSGQDRHGDCNVDVSLKSLDELPYVMGLVRQSYERQMGDGGQQ